LIFSVLPPKQLSPSLVEGLNHFLQLGRAVQLQRKREQQQLMREKQTKQQEVAASTPSTAEAAQQRGISSSSSHSGVGGQQQAEQSLPGLSKCDAAGEERTETVASTEAAQLIAAAILDEAIAQAAMKSAVPATKGAATIAPPAAAAKVEGKVPQSTDVAVDTGVSKTDVVEDKMDVASTSFETTDAEQAVVSPSAMSSSAVNPLADRKEEEKASTSTGPVVLESGEAESTMELERSKEDEDMCVGESDGKTSLVETTEQDVKSEQTVCGGQGIVFLVFFWGVIH